MDDDGIVLNLSFEGQVRPNKKDKSGQRAYSKHRKHDGPIVQHVPRLAGTKRKERPEAHDDPLSGTTNGGEEEDRPSKRVRFQGSHDVVQDPSKRAGQQPGRTGQIISSLFTFNPHIPSADPHAAVKTSKPSNAPLQDSSTFSGLGLDPLLVSHLQSKLGIDKPTSIQRATLSAMLPSPGGAADTSSVTDSLRDVFIQSQTGSGKTLSYLLPIVQDLLPLSSLSFIDRSIGTLAIILAPTRELAKQISDVLEQLLSLRLSTASEGGGEAPTHLTRWLVSGLLTGGATRSHEKARLRKGIPIIVSTPGRLLDHLQHTEAFNVGKCQWLVLDEADRLMDLGFEETITGILQCLEGRRKIAIQAAEAGSTVDVGGWDWSKSRRTVLCSATMREDVQKLAGVALRDPVVIKAIEREQDVSENSPLKSGEDKEKQVTNFTPPFQLVQKYIIVPLKLRLVALVALLRTLLARPMPRDSRKAGAEGMRVIVFLSCTDAVDFYWALLGGTQMGASATTASPAIHRNPPEISDGGSDEEIRPSKPAEILAQHPPLLPNTSIFRLHGSLPQQTRVASLKAFSSASKRNGDKSSTDNGAAVLLCTSVASRGLDMPSVQAVIQYDLPSEGGATEYVHRVGRTARVGRGGEAWAIVAPHEAEWVAWVEKRMVVGEDTSKSTQEVVKRLRAVAVEEILRAGFGGKEHDYEARATQVQLAFERWVLAQTEHAALARKAFTSHVRAYATHPSEEKHLFHVRNLHLGHLAKSFGLRDAPGAMSGRGRKDKNASTSRKHGHAPQGPRANGKMQVTVGERMRHAVKRQNDSRAADEFQVPGHV